MSLTNLHFSELIITSFYLIITLSLIIFIFKIVLPWLKAKGLFDYGHNNNALNIKSFHALTSHHKIAVIEWDAQEYLLLLTPHGGEVISNKLSPSLKKNLSEQQSNLENLQDKKHSLKK